MKNPLQHEMIASRQPQSHFLRWVLQSVITAVLVVQAPTTWAQDDLQKLRDDQEAVAGRYARFERLLSQMADMIGREDPERAELLRRAISEGREKAISGELDAITESLGKGSFGSARERQGNVIKSMQQILTLLQSEDRRSEVEKERERLNELLKDVRNLTARQKAARAAALNSRSPSNAAPDQQQTLKKASDILKDVETHDRSSQEPSDEPSDDATEQTPEDGTESEDETQDSSKDPEDKSSEGSSKQGEESSGTDQESNQGQPKDGNPADAKPSDGQPPGGKPSDQKSPGEQSQQSQDSGQSQQSQQSQSQQQTPGREQLEEAQRAMEKAIEQLKQQQRKEAVEEQDEAIQKLQEAQKKLEETLKQLREEEKEMILSALEARFQSMLSQQTQIFEETVTLGAIPRKEWLNTAITQCRKLSQQQSDLTRECSLTVGLLREDGTSVSILIAVEDIETDMKMVAGRLQQTKAAELTQSMQTDIIEALKELIETAQKEMEEMKQDENQQQQQQQQQSGPQQKSALVQMMAEIKMLRSLQLRVNRRTAIVDRLLQQNDAAEQTGLLEQLQELATRQNRLTESAAELARQMEQRQ